MFRGKFNIKPLVLGLKSDLGNGGKICLESTELETRVS